MKKLIAILGIITALGAGAFALNAVLPAGASNTSLTQTTSSDPGGDPVAKCRGPRAKFKDVLDGLVRDGTITQDQADKIIQAFKDHAPNADHPRMGARRKAAHAHHLLEGMADAAANAIGITTDELVNDVKSGKSVAEVATEHGVDPATVVQAIVDAGTAKIDAAVASGKLTNEQGDKVKSHLSDAATKFVNHTRPEC